MRLKNWDQPRVSAKREYIRNRSAANNADSDPPAPARISKIVLRESVAFGGKIPNTYGELVKLPGIGPNTAGSILAFAFNIPRPFIETNIRTVYIHFFFPAVEKKEGKRACKKINDDEIFPFIEETLDTKNPREWYYALMDYGSHVKKTLGNNLSRSAHYQKQSKFEGSNRQLRSKLLKLVLEKPRTKSSLAKSLDLPASSLDSNIAAMQRQGLIFTKKGKIAA